MTHFDDVRAFHERMGLVSADTPTIPDSRTAELRRTLLEEEFAELRDAIAQGDLAAIAQEAADLLYVTYGLCAAYGIDIDPVFAAVHAANMAKASGPVRADGKRLKPAGWQPAPVAALIAAQAGQSAAPEQAGLFAAPEPTPAPTSAKRLELIFDGGSRGNPGQGYGSYRLICAGLDQGVERLTFPGKLTSNEAEYRTLIAALRAVRAAYDPRAISLMIRGDSTLVIKQINREWKAKDARMAALRDEALGLLAAFAAWKAEWHGRARSVREFGH